MRNKYKLIIAALLLALSMILSGCTVVLGDTVVTVSDGGLYVHPVAVYGSAPSPWERFGFA